jgi:hypothetical protein
MNEQFYRPGIQGAAIRTNTGKQSKRKQLSENVMISGFAGGIYLLTGLALRLFGVL